jgi:hypothetical protein
MHSCNTEAQDTLTTAGPWQHSTMRETRGPRAPWHQSTTVSDCGAGATGRLQCKSGNLVKQQNHRKKPPDPQTSACFQVTPVLLGTPQRAEASFAKDKSGTPCRCSAGHSPLAEHVCSWRCQRLTRTKAKLTHTRLHPTHPTYSTPVKRRQVHACDSVPRCGI